MMKFNTFVTAGLLALAACGAPEPMRIADLDALDRRLVPPGPPAPAAIDEILRKAELSLDDALRLADALNPELEIERRGIDLATAALWEASLGPNPSLTAEIEELRPAGRSLGGSKRAIGVSVPIPIGGRIGAATAAAGKEREAAAIRYVWRRREILGAVKRAFVTVLAAQDAAAAARETRDIAKASRDTAQARLDAGAAPEMEALKAAVGLATADVGVRRAEASRAVAVRTLLALLGNPDVPAERFAGALATRYAVPTLEALRGQVAAHPLVEEAERSRGAAALAIDLARAERIADPEVGLAIGRDEDGETIIEGSFSIPLPIVNRNQAKIAAAETRARQAELRVQAVRNDLAVRLADAYRTFESAQDRATVYRDEILPKAGKAVAQTEEGYQQGKFSLLEVLDAQRTLAEAKEAYVAALSDLNQAAAELETLTGARLQAMR